MNLLKRIYKDSENEIVEYKDLTLFVEKNLASHDQSEIELTKMNLKYYGFNKGKGKILSRTELIEYLWDNEMFVDG